MAAGPNDSQRAFQHFRQIGNAGKILDDGVYNYGIERVLFDAIQIIRPTLHYLNSRRYGRNALQLAPQPV